MSLRAEFTVAYPGANLRLSRDCCDCADDFTVPAHCDAVSPPQRRVRSEHAQHSFDASETVPCVFDPLSRAGDQSSVQIGKTVAPHHELAHQPTSRLCCLSKWISRKKTAPVMPRAGPRRAENRGFSAELSSYHNGALPGGCVENPLS